MSQTALGSGKPLAVQGQPVHSRPSWLEFCSTEIAQQEDALHVVDCSVESVSPLQGRPVLPAIHESAAEARLSSPISERFNAARSWPASPAAAPDRRAHARDGTTKKRGISPRPAKLGGMVSCIDAFWALYNNIDVKRVQSCSAQIDRIPLLENGTPSKAGRHWRSEHRARVRFSTSCWNASQGRKHHGLSAQLLQATVDAVKKTEVDAGLVGGGPRRRDLINHEAAAEILRELRMPYSSWPATTTWSGARGRCGLPGLRPAGPRRFRRVLQGPRGLPDGATHYAVELPGDIQLLVLDSNLTLQELAAPARNWSTRTTARWTRRKWRGWESQLAEARRAKRLPLVAVHHTIMEHPAYPGYASNDSEIG